MDAVTCVMRMYRSIISYAIKVMIAAPLEKYMSLPDCAPFIMFMVQPESI